MCEMLENRLTCTITLNRLFPRGSTFDGVEKRWRRLVVLRRAFSSNAVTPLTVARS
jgi:hypothetical protein